MLDSLAPSLFISFLACTLRTGANDYYVKPSMESECPSTDQPCKTLDEYANKSQKFEGEVRMLFLAGIHNLNKDLTLGGYDTLEMASVRSIAGVVNHESQVKVQLSCCDITIHSVDSFSLTDLTINSTIKHGLVLKRNSPRRTLSIASVNLVGNSLICRYGSNADKVEYQLTFTIQDSVFENSGGTGLQVVDEREQGNLILKIYKSSISNHEQGGISIVTSADNLDFTIGDSTIEGNKLKRNGNWYSAAGLSVYSTQLSTSQVTIQGTHFVKNEMNSGYFHDNHDLSILQPVVVYVSRAKIVTIIDCEFRNNRGTPIRVDSIDENLCLQGTVLFRNNTAQQGGAIALVSTQVSFMPSAHIIFDDNHANDVGGAIFVESTSTMYEENKPNTSVGCFYWFPDWDSQRNLTFRKNSARNGGYHIFGASLKSYCKVEDVDTNGIPPMRSNDSKIQEQFHFNEKKGDSLISSNPSRVCVLNQAAPNSSIIDFCVNESLIFTSTHAVFPGVEFNLNAVLTGAEFGTVTGAVYAQFLPLHTDFEAKLQSQPNQYFQRINRLNISQTPNLVYTVYSNHSYEVLVLTASDVTLFGYGDEDEISRAIQTYFSTKIIPINLLTTPVYINITLLDCPPGFYLDQGTVTMGCVCNPTLCNANSQNTGNISNGTGFLYLRENIWVNAYNNGDTFGVIVHHNCPFNYCKSTSDAVDLLNDPNVQCAMNRAGVLCGKCEPDFNLVLGSNKCFPCSNNNNHLTLLIFFVAAGFLLVFFIKILNMTVSQGTINGLVFYANIMWACQNIFFSHDEDGSIAKTWFPKTFIAWINLDFGIETCLFQGLTTYAKIWLQFVFPLYVWGIAGGMILLARCSERVTRFSGSNSVDTLATLFLLSYSKLLRTIIIILLPANLYVYTVAGDPVMSLTKVVWAFDGTLLYGRVPHIFLLLVALLALTLLWLPYTFALLFIQPLKSVSKYRYLKWIDMGRPLFDTYVGPLNLPNHFWVGLLLLARFILLLTFTLTDTSSPSACVLALVITVVLLLTVLSYTGQLYKEPTKFTSRFLPEKISFCSILELSFLLNLAVVGVSILFTVTDNAKTKTAVVYTSVGTAFLQFLGIALYHFCCAAQKICRLFGCSCNAANRRDSYQTLDFDPNTVVPPTTTTIDIGVNGTYNKKHQ